MIVPGVEVSEKSPGFVTGCGALSQQMRARHGNRPATHTIFRKRDLRVKGGEPGIRVTLRYEDRELMAGEGSSRVKIEDSTPGVHWLLIFDHIGLPAAGVDSGDRTSTMPGG